MIKTTADYTTGTLDIYCNDLRVGFGVFDLFADLPLDEHIAAGYDLYLSGVEIVEEHRGQGFGTAALEQLVADFGTYYLSPDNPGAAKLYDRIGYKLDESSQEYQQNWYAMDFGFGVYQI